MKKAVQHITINTRVKKIFALKFMQLALLIVAIYFIAKIGAMSIKNV